jgi:tRNA(Ile)-lysidine synthase TilS/MesJ
MEPFQRILPKNYSKPIWRAIMEFDMINPGDRIMVGLSGGKDSAFLLYALWVLQKQTVIPFELAAVSIDPGFAEISPRPVLQELCDALGIPLFYEELPHMKDVIFTKEGNQSPCAQCAFFRRGAINRIAVRHGYGKLALGHHHDDAVETFLMSILYSGQITTFLPVTPQDRAGLTVIRPLIYLREKEIRAARKFFNFEPVSSCCPRDGKSTRSEVKALIHQLHNSNHSIYDNLTAAMRFPMDKAVLWPPTLPRDEMRKQYLRKVSWKKE